MSRKSLLLYLVALIVMSGCIETEAEKVGWNQARYEEYSTYYNILRPPSGEAVNKTESDMISKGLTIDEWLISIPKDKNEFENTWYLTFYFIKKGRDVPLSTSPCPKNLYGEGDIANEVRCQTLHTRSRDNKANESYLKAAEYRQKIEDMKMNFSR